MRKMIDNFYKISLRIFLILVGLAFLALLAFAQDVWQEPSQSPPACPEDEPGCDPPLTVSSIEQEKRGSLNIHEVLRASIFHDIIDQGFSYFFDIGGDSFLGGGLRLGGDLNLQGNQLLEARLELGSTPPPEGTGAPVECTADTRGYVYYNTTDEEICVCAGADWNCVGEQVTKFVNNLCNENYPDVPARMAVESVKVRPGERFDLKVWVLDLPVNMSRAEFIVQFDNTKLVVDQVTSRSPCHLRDKGIRNSVGVVSVKVTGCNSCSIDLIELEMIGRGTGFRYPSPGEVAPVWINSDSTFKIRNWTDVIRGDNWVAHLCPGTPREVKGSWVAFWDSDNDCYKIVFGDNLKLIDGFVEFVE
jgi:hypothetical protein